MTQHLENIEIWLGRLSFLKRHYKMVSPLTYEMVKGFAHLLSDKESSLRLSVALELISRNYGYGSWNAASACLPKAGDNHISFNQLYFDHSLLHVVDNMETAQSLSRSYHQKDKEEAQKASWMLIEQGYKIFGTEEQRISVIGDISALEEEFLSADERSFYARSSKSWPEIYDGFPSLFQSILRHRPELIFIKKEEIYGNRYVEMKNACITGHSVYLIGKHKKHIPGFIMLGVTPESRVYMPVPNL